MKKVPRHQDIVQSKIPDKGNRLVVARVGGRGIGQDRDELGVWGR